MQPYMHARSNIRAVAGAVYGGACTRRWAYLQRIRTSKLHTWLL